MKNLFDYNASVGGPIAEDKLWFYSSARFQRSESYIAGLWENKNAGDLTKWLYEADLDDQTASFLKSNTVNTRVTWQASPRNKFNIYFDNSWRYWNASLVGGVSSESEQKYDFPRLRTLTAGWSSPVSNKMLIDVRMGVHDEDIFNFYDQDPNGPYRNLIGVVEQNQVIPGIGVDRHAALSRALEHQRHGHRGQRPDRVGHDRDQGVGLLHHGQPRAEVRLHRLLGHPDLQLAGIEQRLQHPHAERHSEPDHRSGRTSTWGSRAAFAPRWAPSCRTGGPSTGSRSMPACGSTTTTPAGTNTTFGPGPLVPNRNFTIEEEDFYKFKDLSPRLGAAYDIFGNGERPSRRTSASTGWRSIRPRAFRPATGSSLA